MLNFISNTRGPRHFAFPSEAAAAAAWAQGGRSSLRPSPHTSEPLPAIIEESRDVTWHG
jgi:hypothetical protein